MGDLDEVVKEFLVESYENLDQMDRDLVALEQDPANREILAGIFRTIHTIKGTCGFIGFAKLESVAHASENLLSRLRDGELQLNPEITNALLAVVDAVRQMLSRIETTGHEGEGDYSALIETLTRLHQGQGTETGRPQDPETLGESPPPPVVSSPSSRAPARKGRKRAVANRARQTAVPQVSAAQPRDAAEGPHPQGESHGPGVSDSNIRVDVSLLDRLMNLAGELVLARNQILQFSTTQKDTTFVATSQRLNLITTELQEEVMKTRMQPIGNIWSKFPRVVRDLAIACGKQVRIEMEGKETELDKSLIEAIKDPLTHLVRNSVDHGIESPQARVAGGKPVEGRIFLRAFHEGGQVNIEISDDGAGIDPERVKQKALQRALLTPEQAARLSDREVLNLISLPGFSTAEKVTNVSGRGVGMDVVKTNIEKIGGTVDTQSKPGQGTTFKMKIPLTLAIIPALIVTSGGDRYAIPQVSLLELVRLEGEQARSGIEMIHGTPVYRLRGNLLPLVYLSRELRVEDRTDTEADVVNIVVLQADNRQFGLVVESINDTEEIVVKPLGQHLKGIPTFAGATIMGDGKVALILDVLGIAQRANVVSEVRDRALVDEAAQSLEQRANRQTLLLFTIGQDGRMAIPLSKVARLEELPGSAVERVGHQEVVQYRGQILPLIRLSSILDGGPPVAKVEDPAMQVVVYSGQGRRVGLVVDRIVDIVEETITMQSRASRNGMLGSAVIQQRVTELLDVEDVIRATDPSFFARPETAETEA
jgi:two-component system, chemotaxis family, sensor kinase CheA